jgi:hypothetical protein
VPTPAALDTLVDQSAGPGRVELQPSGNRSIEGRGAFGSATPQAVELPDGRSAAWLVPTNDGSWIAVLDDGSTIDVAIDHSDLIEATASARAGTFDPTAGPPMLIDGELVDESTGRSLFTDPLPDTRLVTDGARLIALAGPTDRYGHAVLGDAIEASAVEIIDADGTVTTPIRIPEPDVVEAVSPLLADLNEDGELDVFLTLSNAETGARLAAYNLDGSLIAETAPIGNGNRWRNLLAVAPTGPDGEVEVIDIRTPHIGGTVQFFRDDGSGELVLVASADGYSTHTIGSRNLDLGIVSDADGDGQLDVLLPTQSRDQLAVLSRDDSDNGVREITRVALGAPISSNVSAVEHRGGVAYAVGTADGRVVIWPAAQPS